MSEPYRIYENLAALLMEAPEDSIISRVIYKDEQVNVTLFAFAAGQAISEHTAAVPAVIQILSGEAVIGLGENQVEAQPGTWIHMDARLPHSVQAKTPVTMLLTMLKSG